MAGLDISLNELNDLAGELARLDTIQGIAYRGLLEMAVQEKVQSNGGIITMQELRDLAVSASADCCHVVDAADDAQLGRFYAENDFMPELEGISDTVFEMLDFAKIGKALRTGEGGVYVGGCYVVRDGGLLTAPPCPKELPEKPGYLFQLTFGLHPDYRDWISPPREKSWRKRRSGLVHCNGKILPCSTTMASSPMRQRLLICPQKWKPSMSLPKR